MSTNLTCFSLGPASSRLRDLVMALLWAFSNSSLSYIALEKLGEIIKYLLAIFKFLLQMTNLTLMTQTLNVYLYGWKFSTYLIKSSWKSIAHIPGNLLWEFPIHLGWQFTLALKILANNPLSVMWAVHLIIGRSTGQSNICLFLYLAMYSCLFTSQEVTKASKATHY